MLKAFSKRDLFILVFQAPRCINTTSKEKSWGIMDPTKNPSPMVFESQSPPLCNVIKLIVHKAPETEGTQDYRFFKK